MKYNSKSLISSFMMISMVIVTFFTSCEKNQPDQDVIGVSSPRLDTNVSGIILYYEMTGLREHDGYNNNPEESEYPFDYRAIPIKGEMGTFVNEFGYSKARKAFCALRTLNNDSTFKQSPHYKNLYHNGALQAAWKQDFVDVRVEALTDFDAEHPAGSSLSEIAYLTYVSCYDFIQKGYRFDNGDTGNGPYIGLCDYINTFKGMNEEEISSLDVEEMWFARMNYVFTPVLNDGLMEWISHIKVAEIAANPLKCVSVSSSMRMHLSFSKPPKQNCKVRISIDLHTRGTDEPTTTVSRIFNIHP